MAEYPSYYPQNLVVIWVRCKELMPNTEEINPSLLNLCLLPADLAFHTTCGNQSKFQILYQ